MGLNFPNTPSVGQLYPVPAIAGVPVYSWDGEKWTTANSFGEAPTDGHLYGRKSSTWARGVDLTGDTMTGALVLNADPAVALGAATKQYSDAKVAKAGDTMTDALTITAPTPALNLNKTTLSSDAPIAGQYNGVNRWVIEVNNGSAETGSNAGSDFDILRYSDTGSLLGTGFSITRSNGAANFNSTVTLNGSASILNILGGTAGYSAYIQAASGSYARYRTSSSRDWSFGGDSSGQFGIWDETAGAQRFSFATNGTASFNFNLTTQTAGYQPGGGPWLALSDARIKNVLGTYDHGLDEIMQLQPVRFTYKGNDTLDPPHNETYGEPPPAGEPVPPYNNSLHYRAATDGTEFIGLVAQDTEGPMPEMVQLVDAYIDGVPVADLREMNTAPLVFAMINAIKTLTARIEVLEAN